MTSHSLKYQVEEARERCNQLQAEVARLTKERNSFKSLHIMEQELRLKAEKERDALKAEYPDRARIAEQWREAKAEIEKLKRILRDIDGIGLYLGDNVQASVDSVLKDK